MRKCKPIPLRREGVRAEEATMGTVRDVVSALRVFSAKPKTDIREGRPYGIARIEPFDSHTRMVVSNGISSLIVDVQVKVEAVHHVYVRLSGKGKNDSTKGVVTISQDSVPVALPITDESNELYFGLVERITNDAILSAEKYGEMAMSPAYFDPHLIGDCLSAVAPLAEYIELYIPRSYHEPALIRGKTPGSLKFAALVMPFRVPLKEKEEASK
jgi:hypothetical protein